VTTDWKKNRVYTTKTNKRRKQVVFQPGDWVWVHMRKKRFPAQRKFKLQPWGYGPFQIVERINDNTYKINFLGEYDVNATFNVFYPTLFNVDDDLGWILLKGEGMMRTNPTPILITLEIHWRYQVDQLQEPE